MRVFTLKAFARWARKEGIDDRLLNQAVAELQLGQSDGNLGGHVVKKRVARDGGGKRGGWRTLLAFRHEDRAFFVYGFSKSDKDNVTPQELKALKEYAKDLLALDQQQVTAALNSGELLEVENDETVDS